MAKGGVTESANDVGGGDELSPPPWDGGVPLVVLKAERGRETMLRELCRRDTVPLEAASISAGVSLRL